MKTDSSWYARRFGQPQQQRQEPQYQSYPQPQQPPPQQQVYRQQVVQPQNLGEALQLVQQGLLPTRGGEATRSEQTRCPSCGSTHFFSRRNAGGVTTQRGIVAPAPQCYSCGYTPLFTQGDPAVWESAQGAQ